MQPTHELIDDIYRSRVLRARAAPPEQKLLAGLRLFEDACRMTIAGIRHQFPEADSERIRQILVERLAWRRRLDEQGLYQPVEEPR